MRVLVIEDDPVLGRAISQGLSDQGDRCLLCDNGESGLVAAGQEKFDTIVLDLMLPDVHGLEVLKKLRNEKNDTPVLILTALGSIDDRVTGLNAGADDYLVKPFAFAELSARLDAIRRRSSRGSATTLRVGELQMELTTRKVERAGRDIDLTPTEFRLLEYLMRCSDQVVTRRMLCEHLWEADWEGVTNVIEVHINRLRSKINKGDEPQMIHTVRGSGYVLRAA
ncbi:MAG: response regulator transcription factor [Pirellulales bacterium]